MLTRFRKAAALGLVAAITALGSWALADGIYQTYPAVGQGSFCASTVTGVVLPSSQGNYGVVPGSTQGTGVSICGQTVPAGPTTFTGNEHAAFDMNALGTSTNGAPPATATVNITQLGQGAFTNNTATGNQTIANSVVWYFEGATTTNPTLTFPSTPIEGQILHIILGSGLTTGITTAANTTVNANQVCLPACGAISGTTAGTGYAWRFVAPNTWYRFQ